MRRPIRLRHIPARAITGAYILNSGLSKQTADEETAGHLHGMAKSVYPALGEMDAKDFVRLLSAGEIAVGSLLLLPVVPTALAGGALAGFAGALLGLYLRTPGMREEGSLKPTPQGIPLAKDSWLLGTGLTLLIDGLTDRKQPYGLKPRDSRAAGKQARKAEKKARKASKRAGNHEDE